MAHGTLTVKNSIGAIKNLPVGYSWTTLFFGAIPSAIRLDFKNTLMFVVLILLANYIVLGAGFGVVLIYSFVYNNKICIPSHLHSGWKVDSYLGSKTIEEVNRELQLDLVQYK